MPMPTIIIVNKIRVRSNTSDGALWTINISMKMFHYRVLVTSHVMLAPDSRMRSDKGLSLDVDRTIQCQSDNDHSSQCRDMTHVTRVILHGSRHCSHHISISENILLWNPGNSLVSLYLEGHVCVILKSNLQMWGWRVPGLYYGIYDGLEKLSMTPVVRGIMHN